MKLKLVLQSGAQVQILSPVHLFEWETRLKQLGIRYVKVMV